MIAEKSREMPSRLSRKVLFVVTHSGAGGAQELWFNLIHGFREAGFDADILALYPVETLREAPEHTPWRYASPARPKGPIDLLRLFASLVRELRHGKPDVVFTALPAANVILPVAVKLAGVDAKVVISHHSPAGTQSRMLDFLDGLTGKLANVSTVISVSNVVSRSLRRSPVYERKKRTVMNALPPALERMLAGLSLDRAQRRRGRKVCTTGRLRQQKNHPLLIRAAQHLPDVEVEIIGGGLDDAKLKGLADALGVSDRVTFAGQKTRLEALRMLAQADIFSQVSLFEGHSLALIEAAKLGLPLIVSNVPVQIESITAKDGTLCGAVVDLEDDAGLAREILRLLDDPGAYERGVALSAKLANDVTYVDMITAYKEIAGIAQSHSEQP